MLINSQKLSNYPWYADIYIDWGDGSIQTVANSSVLGSGGAPSELTRKTWLAQSLAYKQITAGSFPIRLKYSKGKMR